MEYAKLDLKFHVEHLQDALEKSDLWDKYPFRKMGDSPHKEMDDIWIRYNDIQPYLKKGSFDGFTDEHDSIWYHSPLVPIIKPMAYELMAKVKGERLGGILITKLPPYGKIREHVDGGWHASYYDKYYVCVKDQGSKFKFPSGEITPEEGEVYKFDNSKPHSVENCGAERIAMIICIRGDA